MSELAAILAAFPYAETVEATVADGQLTVTVAEASRERNRAFVRLLSSVDDIASMSEDQEIEIFCAACLRSWDMEEDGEPVPIEQAEGIFKASFAGRMLWREIATVAMDPERFRKSPSQKKPSPATTRKASSSGTKRRKSQAKH